VIIRKLLFVFFVTKILTMIDKMGEMGLSFRTHTFERDQSHLRAG